MTAKIEMRLVDPTVFGEVQYFQAENPLQDLFDSLIDRWNELSQGNPIVASELTRLTDLRQQDLERELSYMSQTREWNAVGIHAPNEIYRAGTYINFLYFDDPDDDDSFIPDDNIATARSTFSAMLAEWFDREDVDEIDSRPDIVLQTLRRLQDDDFFMQPQNREDYFPEFYATFGNAPMRGRDILYGFAGTYLEPETIVMLNTHNETTLKDPAVIREEMLATYPDRDVQVLIKLAVPVTDAEKAMWLGFLQYAYENDFPGVRADLGILTDPLLDPVEALALGVGVDRYLSGDTDDIEYPYKINPIHEFAYTPNLSFDEVFGLAPARGVQIESVPLEGGEGVQIESVSTPNSDLSFREGAPLPQVQIPQEGFSLVTPVGVLLALIAYMTFRMKHARRAHRREIPVKSETRQ